MKWTYALLFLVGISTTFAQSSNDKPLRVGVVGLVHTHVHWILGREDRGDIKIVGIVEPNRELAQRYANQHGYSMDLVYDDLETMLDKTQPEAVTAFNTIYDHLSVVETCAPRGVHVMVEKPLAVSLDHAQQMAKLARRHNIHLLTNYETTWYGSNHEAYRLVHEENAIGDLRKIVVHDGHPGPEEIGVNEEFLEWLTDPKWNGAGALTDFGCYGANLITWLMQGERPTSVTAVTQQIKPDIYPKVDDEATIIVTYPEMQGIIQASWNWPTHRKDMEMYGKTGYVHALNATNMRFRPSEQESEQTLKAQPLENPQDDPFAYLTGVVRGNIKVKPTDLSALENNLVVMEILDAAIRSAESGKTIELD
ncbi:Gfo/Idh/MocA family protein [Tunicatimonas pelagia]|uniref:Gfo/Idh/MocA family protein n=1 Tax=Tunicatimonas pelagia TaxID=931531 RepID=UPI0026652E9B|nr:Gfo/Idh/MocA family oxidoreductase [Tunicatimonas pelagia]WKN41429.1 Gfo/Idh/MocA family oxidoreductase [Tunicatimonas pelagia]